MDLSTLLISQTTDVFRIGLLCGLLYTMERTRAHTGVLVPLIGGLVFVAVIIPSTIPVAGVSLPQAIISGVFANALIISVLWSVWTFVKQRLQ